MEKHVIQYNRMDSIDQVPENIQLLIEKAREIAKHAYSPYSKFSVGAALQLEDQTIVLGSNQENIAYPSGLCAERTALFFAGANYPSKKIERIVVVGSGDLIQPEDLVSPCGSCRQVMVESAQRQNETFEVYLVSQDGHVAHFKDVYDLLPFNFGKR